jgi:thymidylate synthase
LDGYRGRRSSYGFPLLTTKRMFWRGIVHELLWFISGSTSIQYLVDNGVHIWDEWADQDGEVGLAYGHQWRHWNSNLDGSSFNYRPGVDQLQQAIELIRNDPESRRNVVTAWNPDEVQHCGLPPCHMFYQFDVQDGKLSCHVYMRSADIFLGVPFNIASYALLVHMIAALTDYKPGSLTFSFGNVHLYDNHREQAVEQLGREPMAAPWLEVGHGPETIDHFRPQDLHLRDYRHRAAIRADVAV